MQILLRKLLRPLPPPQPIDSQRPSSFVLATGSLSYTRSWTAHKKGPYTQSQNAISNCRTLQHGAEVQKGRICRIKARCWWWAEERKDNKAWSRFFFAFKWRAKLSLRATMLKLLSTSQGEEEVEQNDFTHSTLRKIDLKLSKTTYSTNLFCRKQKARKYHI